MYVCMRDVPPESLLVGDKRKIFCAFLVVLCMRFITVVTRN